MDISLLLGQVAIPAAVTSASVAALSVLCAAFISSNRQMRAALASVQVAYEVLQHNIKESDVKRAFEVAQIRRASVISISEKELDRVQEVRNLSIELMTLTRAWERKSDLPETDITRTLILVETLCFLVPPSTPVGEVVNLDLMQIRAMVDGKKAPWEEDRSFFSRMMLNFLLATTMEEDRIRRQMLAGDYIERRLEPYR